MKPVFRYDEHMPKTDDVTLIVLKGHLLVEEVLFQLAETALPNPQYLPKFMFHKLACVVRAAVPKRSEDPCWELILTLNSLRNDFAHNLVSSKRQACLVTLFRVHDQVQPNPSMNIDKNEENSLSQPERLRLVIEDSMKFLLSIIFDYGKDSPTG
jgi:hypothetical protein